MLIISAVNYLWYTTVHMLKNLENILGERVSDVKRCWKPTNVFDGV